MTAGPPCVPYSHYTCDHSPGERDEVSKKRSVTGFLLGPLWLDAVKAWEMGSLADLPGRSLWRVRYVGSLGLSVSILTLALSQALYARGQPGPRIQSWLDT